MGWKVLFICFFLVFKLVSPITYLLCQVALSDTGIPKVSVDLAASQDDHPEIDVSDEEFLQFDTSGVPVIITLTKVSQQNVIVIFQ